MFQIYQPIIIITIIFFVVKEFSTSKTASKTSIDPRFLLFGVKSLWERSEKRVRGKVYRPNGVMYIDANICPSDLEQHLPHAVMSKIHMNYTGPEPLNHPDEAEIVDRILLNAKNMFKVVCDVHMFGHCSFKWPLKTTIKLVTNCAKISCVHELFYKTIILVSSCYPCPWRGLPHGEGHQ